MQSMNFLSAMSTVMLLTVLSSVDGQTTPSPVFKCYTCTSTIPTCVHDYFVRSGTPTDINCGCCVKNVVNNNGNIETERLCVKVDDPDQFQNCLQSGTKYTCTDDLCNGAHSATATTAYWRFLSVLAVVYVVIEFGLRAQ